ncbi:folylpolyglutamate synthase/dihydrofolate synthase family protein [Niallia sp. XMNu-256]|uniref:bifunctional folylpolyglutamate synthase/dihydrofolate synthase n=1 Tax=Niallia sp. XMNu-256 TaxID=3082444 RepID=UPI0030D0C2D3
MFQTYDEALHWIHSRLRAGIKPGLKRMEWMLEKLNHPENKLTCVHIGGTNGKGSTVTYLRSILESAGYQTGTFTSPYIEQFNERISVNGQPIPDEDIIKLVNVIYPLSLELEETELGGPSEFEIITAMAIYYFAELHPVDIAIFEVGLGGRFDSTNVIKPLLEVITNIGLDHVQFLGDTYKEIAFEKAGIIKKGTSLVTAVDQPDAQDVILSRARELEVPAFLLDRDIHIQDHVSVPTGESFTWKDAETTLANLEISMFGKHQTKNAALAVKAAHILGKKHDFNMEEGQIREGLKSAYWPGRFEVLSQEPFVVIDGAHNEEGVNALVDELNHRYPSKKKNIIFSALADKSLDKMIHKLDEVADKLTFVTFEYPRASKVEDLYQLSKNKNKHHNADWKQAITEELQSLNSDEIFVVTGSLYFISEVKPFIKGQLAK